MGIGDFLKGLFNGESVASEPPDAGDFRSATDLLLSQAMQEIKHRDDYWNLKVAELTVFREHMAVLPDGEKVKLAVAYAAAANYWSGKHRQNYSQEYSRKQTICKAFAEQLLRGKISLADEDFPTLIYAFIRYKECAYRHVMGWPAKSLTTLAQKKYKEVNIPAQVVEAFLGLKDELATAKNLYYEKQALKLIEQIDSLLHANGGAASIKPVYLLGNDQFATYANAFITQLTEAEKPHWYEMLALCQKASGSSPSKKFLTDGKVIIDKMGAGRFVEVLLQWFNFIIQMKEQQTPITAYYTQYHFLASVNLDSVKGMVWLSAEVNNTLLLNTVGALAERAYRHVPGVGQICTGLGNAAVFALYKAGGLEGINHLSRLRLKVKQGSTQTLIQKYLDAAAQERGVSADEIEDLAVDDFGITNGMFQVSFPDYEAKVTIEKIGKVSLKWYRNDGTLQKSDPAAIKENQPEELKKLKATCKQLEATLSTQRDRLDRSFKNERSMAWAHFNTYYHNHGLVSFISRRLIWRFQKKHESFNCIYLDGEWVDCQGVTFMPGDDCKVSLWHPATDTVKNVQAWRQLMLERQIQQPVKQAFREVYILTDAELNTRTYSNRMAAHLLKQHQFSSLAKTRGWRYALQGAFDGGSNGVASITLPQQQLVAEYWVNGVDNVNDTGIFNYVATDQVRFKNANTNAVLQLVDIPVIPFSELMRDVDLFVGVASVGNDPTWRDSGGIPGHLDYWHNYSFGDLSEMAKTRKQILENLVPRLKIAKVSHVTDKFLIVKGKLRTYKIHMGSTNILMEPNDEYLCIVPDRGQKSTDNLFLPFEGDSGLSIVISKALLLAEDDKITDVTITRQINRK